MGPEEVSPPQSRAAEAELAAELRQLAARADLPERKSAAERERGR